MNTLTPENMLLNIQTEDRYIYDKNQIWHDLFQCHLENRPVIIDLKPEGACAESMGLYALLDKFCMVTKTDPGSITIRTANMLETHPAYTIVRQSEYWYEISIIKEWWQHNSIDTGTTPSRHFGNFVGRSRWPRLWVAAWLDKFHRNKTLQTFHSSLRCNYRTDAEHGVYDWIGLEDLVHYDCDIVADVVTFLDQCPRYIEDDLTTVKHTKTVIEQSSHYPLQHPANLNIIKFYSDIFVDVIMEQNITGRSFLATEKVWRCILAKRPFIVVSNRDYLHNLRKLGFKTFYDWWDEDYDSFENQTRIQKTLAQLDIIASWSPDKLNQLLHDMQKILDHNYETFMQLDFGKVQKVFDE